MTARSRVLLSALALTLGACAWLAGQDDEEIPVVQARVQHIAAASSPPAARGPAVEPVPRAASRTAWPAPPSRALAAWAAPAASTAPRVAAAMPAAASQAAAPPRFPYTWIGRIDTGGDVQVLLNGPQRTFGARAGEVLDGRWRIEQVAATRLQLTWLPTGEAVTVDAR